MKLTMQEYFNVTIQHLVDQGERAYNRDEASCYYKLGDLNCAVGAHIPAGHPCFEDEVQNTWSVEMLLSYYPDLEEHIVPKAKDDDSDVYEFVSALQDLHDSGVSWDPDYGFVGDVERIAEDYGLEVPNTKDQK